MFTITLAELPPIPIVGMHFRPPAKAIMAWLPAGSPLLIRPEPENQFDPLALAVYCHTDVFRRASDEAQAELWEAVAGFGYDETQMWEQEEWHLGYLARDQIILTGPGTCKLGFSMKGKYVALGIALDNGETTCFAGSKFQGT